MEIRGSLSLPRLATETAVGLSSLKLGVVLNVRVEAELSSQRYLLKLLPGGESLTARTSLDLQPGKVVQLEVARLGQEPELRLSAPALMPRDAETVPNALLRLLPRQAPIGDAATAFVALIEAAEQLPSGIAPLAKSLLAALPTAAQLGTPSGLKAAVADSGQFFEARLAQALAQGRDFPDSDVKGQLLRLVAALSKPNSRSVAEGGARQLVGNAGQARSTGSQVPLSAVAGELLDSSEAPTASVARSLVSSQPASSAPGESGEAPTETSADVPAQPIRSASQVSVTTVDVANAGASRAAPESVRPPLTPNSTDHPTPPEATAQRVEFAESPPQAPVSTRPAAEGQSSFDQPTSAEALFENGEVPESLPQASNRPGPAAEGRSLSPNPALSELASVATPGPRPDGGVFIETPADVRLAVTEQPAGSARALDSTQPDDSERATTAGVLAQTGESAAPKPHDLQTKLEATLARLTIDQLAAQQSPQGLSWRFDLPYLDGDQPGNARLDVQAEDQRGADGAARRVWSVSLELEPPGLGRFVARILWDGEKVDSYLWSDRDATGALIATHSDRLRARLEEAGLRVGRLEQPVRRPESPPRPQPSQPLLDLTA